MLKGQVYSHTPLSHYRFLIALLLPAHRKDRETLFESDKGAPRGHLFALISTAS
jgi:hypothetical protein